MVEWLKQNDVLPLTQVTLFDAERESKVFVNGSWIGVQKCHLIYVKNLMFTNEMD